MPTFIKGCLILFENGLLVKLLLLTFNVARKSARDLNFFARLLKLIVI